MTVDLINSHFPSCLITNWLPASISSLSRRISQQWGRPSHHQRNKRKSLSTDLIAVNSGLRGTLLHLGLIRNDRPVFCISAGDIELEEEVWTCGVDRFSQRVRKFESKAILLQTSALSQTFPSSPSMGKQSAPERFQPSLPELQIWSRAD